MSNLFIVGAQRSGTTYLYQVLDSHPQVSMSHPVRPEPKFFMNEELFMKGRDYYEKTYFSDRKMGSVFLGEKSTSYFESAEVPQRIKEYYPEARIIIILRDPVLRAYSNYCFSVANNTEKMNFKEALAAESDRIHNVSFSSSVTPFAYRQRGQYMDYINRFLEVFDISQIKVIIFEEFANDLPNVQALYRWLGLNSDLVPPSLNMVYNSSPIIKDTEQASFRELAMGYRKSIERLEIWLGRRIDSWHKHHQGLISGAPE